MEIDKTKRLGIYAVLKPNSENRERLGHQPFGKYRGQDTYSFGDANYHLLADLGEDAYVEYETSIMNAVNEQGEKSGTVATKLGDIEWELISEAEYWFRELEHLGYSELAEKLRENPEGFTESQAIKHIQRKFYMIRRAEDKEAFESAKRYISYLFPMNIGAKSI